MEQEWKRDRERDRGWRKEQKGCWEKWVISIHLGQMSTELGGCKVDN